MLNLCNDEWTKDVLIAELPTIVLRNENKVCLYILD